MFRRKVLHRVYAGKSHPACRIIAGFLMSQGLKGLQESSKSRTPVILGTGGLCAPVTGGFFLQLSEVYSSGDLRFIYWFGLLIFHVIYTPYARSD